MAMRTGTADPQWLLGDHLGSTSVVANYDGTLYAGQGYKAWGEQRYATGISPLPTTFRYTGQRESTSFGLYYYGARWYDTALGQFTQADSIIPALGNPQDWDRYSYVRNNPLRYNDPSGNRPCDEERGCGEVVDEFQLKLGHDYEGEWDTRKQKQNQENLDRAAQWYFFLLAIASEPADWAMTVAECIEGNCSAWVLLGFVPFIPGNLANKIDNLVPYQIGKADELLGLSKIGDTLDIHHAPQGNPASQIIKDYNYPSGPAIALPHAEHLSVNTANIVGKVTGTPRDLLAKTVSDLRNYTQAPNSSLNGLIGLVKSMFPGVFNK